MNVKINYITDGDIAGALTVIGDNPNFSAPEWISSCSSTCTFDFTSSSAYVLNLGSFSLLIFISDGDIIRNDTTRQGDLFPLGFYKYTRQSFANLDLLTNAVDFLCDSSGLVSLNAKNIQLRPLNTPKIKSESKKWKMINLIIPVILIIIFGIVYNLRRIRKYTGKI